MSIAEFSRALREPALKAFRNANVGKKEINPLIFAISNNKSVRTHEEAKERTNFLISSSKIAEIRELLIEDFPDLPSTSVLINRAKSIESKYINSISIKEIKLPSGKLETTIVYENIVFGDGIDGVLKEIFGEGTKGYIAGKSSGAYQKGHVVGLTTNLLEKSRDKLSYTVGPKETDETKQLAKTIRAVDSIINDLRKKDFETSNYSSEEVYNVIGDYTKTSKQYLVELQLKKGNSTSGGAVGREIAALRKELRVSRDDISGALFSSFLGTDTIFQSLLTMKSSPSMLSLIEDSVMSALDPSSTWSNRQKEYKASGINIAELTSKVNVDRSRLRRSLAKEIAKLEKLKVKLTQDKKNITRTQQGRFFSITNLQILLQARLSQQIKENMGDGTSKSLLNLRTGRLAETVKIDRIVPDRAGTLQIFYRYMEYPYATFAPGGRQSSPPSRDPNILIQKSIREIAMHLVENRLRISSV